MSTTDLATVYRAGTPEELDAAAHVLVDGGFRFEMRKDEVSSWPIPYTEWLLVVVTEDAEEATLALSRFAQQTEEAEAQEIEADLTPGQVAPAPLQPEGSIGAPLLMAAAAMGAVFFYLQGCG